MHSALALDIETLVMPDKVVASHAKFESECSACHVAFSRDRQNSLCVDCHQDINNDQMAATGFHGRNPEAKNSECVACHTEHKGRAADIVALNTDTFDHSNRIR